MFEQLKRRTIDILAEKAANYPFEDNVDEDETSSGGEEGQIDEKKERRGPEQYDLPEGMAQLGISDGQLMNSLRAICDQELDECDHFGENEASADLFGNEIWNQRLTQLQKCHKKMHELDEKSGKCDQILNELREKYNSVAAKTSSLHDACDRMMSEQTQLAAANERISASLHYYQQYEWLLKKLATPKLSLTGTLFTQILSTIHECISYLRTHPEQREADQYLHKYEQCLSRSLTAIKAGVLSDLEACRQDVLYRQSRPSSAQSQPTGQSRPTLLSSMDNDDAFALLYGIFGVKANAIRNAFQQAHQFFAEYPEYQTVVAECEHEYFATRVQLLRPIVQATIQALCQRHQNSSCTLTRDGCTFLLRLCDDEFRLYRQFFVLGGGGDPGTRSSMTPITPSASSFFSFWPLQSAAQSNQFDAFIEGLCRILYDTLRPLIIHNPHLETLAQLCTLLKVEMIDERCGLIQFNSSAPVEMDPLGQQPHQTLGNPRTGFARVISELVADVVERIVYRTSLFSQSDILDYNPAPGDLVYPERLLMMREINEGGGIAPMSKNYLQNEQQPKVDEELLENAEMVGPLPPKRGTAASSARIGSRPAQVSSTSPIDQHCLWYPTVKRTVMCLSKLYRCLDPTVFLNISRELLDACCQSLELAVQRIRSLPIQSDKATIHDCPNRTLDAELFMVKHLLILREQTNPYRQHQKHSHQQQLHQQHRPPFSRSNSVLSSSGSVVGPQSPPVPAPAEAQILPQLDYQLDLGKYTASMLQLLSSENRARWFEFGSNNALLSLLLLTPVHVSELQTDSRRIIEHHLKRWCHSMIGHVTGLLLGPFANFQAELDQFQSEQEQRARDQLAPLVVASTERFNPRALYDRCAEAFKQLKQNWPQVRAAFSLYIGVRETEEILLQPIRRAVSNAFSAVCAFSERHYDEEQRQVISAPGQEQIWLIVNATSIQ